MYIRGTSWTHWFMLPVFPLISVSCSAGCNRLVDSLKHPENSHMLGFPPSCRGDDKNFSCVHFSREHVTTIFLRTKPGPWKKTVPTEKFLCIYTLDFSPWTIYPKRKAHPFPDHGKTNKQINKNRCLLKGAINNRLVHKRLVSEHKLFFKNWEKKSLAWEDFKWAWRSGTGILRGVGSSWWAWDRGVGGEVVGKSLNSSGMCLGSRLQAQPRRLRFVQLQGAPFNGNKMTWSCAAACSGLLCDSFRKLATGFPA